MSVDVNITDKKIRTSWNSKDLTNQTFGRLIVIQRAESHITVGGQKVARWLCQCECGNRIIVRGSQLSSGKTQSCGCLRNDRVKEKICTHNSSNSRLYHIWSHMKQRCENPNVERYPNYGGRGIKVCEEWRNFETFKEWAVTHGYNENLTIDRINTNKDYCPDNCRWTSWKTQANNTTRNHYITYNDETHTLSEWSSILNISYTVLRARINRSKWDIEKAFTTPVKKVI